MTATMPGRFNGLVHSENGRGHRELGDLVVERGGVEVDGDRSASAYTVVQEHDETRHWPAHQVDGAGGDLHDARQHSHPPPSARGGGC